MKLSNIFKIFGIVVVFMTNILYAGNNSTHKNFKMKIIQAPEIAKLRYTPEKAQPRETNLIPAKISHGNYLKREARTIVIHGDQTTSQTEGEPQWHDQVILASEESGPKRAPTMTCDNDGNYWAAIEDYDDSISPHAFVAIYKSEDGGQTWSYFSAWPDQMYAQTIPTIAYANGYIFVSYTSNYKIHIAKLPVNDPVNIAIFDPPMPTINPGNGEIVTRGRICSDAEQWDFNSPYIYLAYNYKDYDGGYQVFFTYTTDLGTSWMPLTSLGGVQPGNYTDDVGIDYGYGDGLYISYISLNGPGQNDLVVRKSTDYGESFSAATTISVYSKNKLGPRVAAFNNKVLIAYELEWQADDHDILMSVSEDGGSTWSTGLAVANTTNEERFPDVSHDRAGNFYLTAKEAGPVVAHKGEGTAYVSSSGETISTGYSASDDDFTAVAGNMTSSGTTEGAVASWVAGYSADYYSVYANYYNDTVPCTPPDAVTDNADNITQTSTTLHGTADPNACSATAWFQCGNETTHQSVGSGDTGVSYSSGLSGLAPNTTYHFRAVAQNDGGTDYGADKTFTTPPPTCTPPDAVTDNADNITQTSATLHGTADPNACSATAWFQWGTGNETTHQSVGSGDTGVSYSSGLSGLAPNTTYHFRAVAQNDGGIDYSDDISFVTLSEECAVFSRVAASGTPSQGNEYVISVYIDMSASSSPDDKLGSYTASLTWDPTKLEYSSYSGGDSPFNDPTVNEGNVDSGILNFSKASSSGKTGDIKIIQVAFNVIGGCDETGTLDLEYSAMAAAGSFTNLLPALCIEDGNYTISCGILGDVNGDDSANSTDALIILSCDVGLDVSQFCPMNCGDANADGLVNSTDALIILSYDVGLSVPYSVGQPGCPGSVTQCPGCNP